MKFHAEKSSRKSIMLTVYNNFTAIKEIWSLNTEKEVDHLIIKDLPSGIDADSFFVKGVSVIEQSYDAGTLTKKRLLKKYIGQLITIKNLELGLETKVRLLSAESDFIGEIEETGEIVINPSGEIILPSVDKMLFYPSITCRIEPSQLEEELELYYLVSGLRCEANYIVELTEENFLLDGWIKIVNHAGADFEHVVYDQLWEMESATHDYRVKDSRTLEFHMRMGAEKSVDLEFTYKVLHR